MMPICNRSNDQRGIIFSEPMPLAGFKHLFWQRNV
jgi:hypothetical protein